MAQYFVEVDVLLVVYFVLIPQPNGFVCVQLLPFVDCFLNLLSSLCLLGNLHIILNSSSRFGFDFDFFLIQHQDGEIDEL